MATFRIVPFLLLLAVTVALGFAPCESAAQVGSEGESGVSPASSKELSQARMDYMVRAMQKYHVVLDGDEDWPATMIPDATLRWSNPLGDVMDGLLVVYAASPAERPGVIAHFHGHGTRLNWREMHEFASVHPGELRLMRGDREVWKPSGRYGTFQKLEGAPAPSENKVLRLAQMKRMAERFVIVDHFREPRSAPVPVELRLLSRPVYRYGSDDGEIMDAALFTFVLTTDPEANLLLEIRRNGTGYEWQYGLFPTSISLLEGKLDGELVWTKPEAAVFGNRSAPHYPAVYRGDVGEPRLQTLFPDSIEDE